MRTRPILILILFLLGGLAACSAQEKSAADSALNAENPSCFASISRPEPGARHVIMNVGSGKSLDISAGSLEAGTPLLQWTFHGARHQQFIPQPQGNGYHTLTAEHSQQRLDVRDRSLTAGAPIQQWPAHGEANQDWQLASAGKGQYRTVSHANRQVLTVAGDSRDDGAAIVQQPDTGSPFQRWMMIPFEKMASVSCPGPATPDGFAAGATGGGSQTAQSIQTCDELVRALESDQPARLTLDKSIDCRRAAVPQPVCAIACGPAQPGKFSFRVPVPGQTCRDLGNPTDETVLKTRTERRIHVRSNKSLIGLGSTARILGATLDLSGSSNIILRNFTLEDINPHLVEGGDGITLAKSERVWIDHLRLRLISDGFVDIKDSRGITLSWNHLDGRNPAVCGGQHHYTHLVSHSQVTFHHNFWDAVSGRNPKLEGASTRAHLYSNLWKDIPYFAINGKDGAAARIEGNVFDNARRPHWNEGGTAFFEAHPESNRYRGRSLDAGEPRDHTGPVFQGEELYPYRLDALEQVETLLPTATGPQ